MLIACDLPLDLAALGAKYSLFQRMIALLTERFNFGERVDYKH
jgi:hypothetical protein